MIEKNRPRYKHISRHIQPISSLLSLVKKNQPYIKDRPEIAKAKRQYKKSLAKLHIQRSDATKFAVVIHLYYVESWIFFSQKLRNLDQIPFDLFISITPENKDFTGKIKKIYRQAYVCEVPNRGRDVLPFMMLASHLEAEGYEYVLKLHSKKSPHRTDGSDWLADMVENLIPDNSLVTNEVIKTLQKKQTGLVGAAGQYIPLTVNFEANGEHMKKILDRIYRDRTSYEALQTQRSSYGFFAGTMFWARLDALAPVIRQGFKISDFAPEEGQIDGTFAHALERVFCLVAEIDKKMIYEVSSHDVKQIDYKTDNIPDWSDVYIGPKSKSV